MEVTNGGMIRGVVKLQGEIRELPAPKIFKEVCKGVPNESVVVGLEGGVRYAVLTLEGVTKGKSVERETVNELDNQGCGFVPHIQAAALASGWSSRTATPSFTPPMPILRVDNLILISVSIQGR